MSVEDFRICGYLLQCHTPSSPCTLAPMSWGLDRGSVVTSGSLPWLPIPAVAQRTGNFPYSHLALTTWFPWPGKVLANPSRGSLPVTFSAHDLPRPCGQSRGPRCCGAVCFLHPPRGRAPHPTVMTRSPSLLTKQCTQRPSPCPLVPGTNRLGGGLKTATCSVALSTTRRGLSSACSPLFLFFPTPLNLG